MHTHVPIVSSAASQQEHDQKLIRAAYRRLLRATGDTELMPEDKAEIRKAFEFALVAHGDQRRKSGEPYITHPLEVARICFEEMGLGYKSIIAAILHDVVEDTPVTLDEIDREFGPKISKIVDGLTKLDGLYNVEIEQAENFKKVLSTLVEDVRVVLIKMADRLHNLRTIASMPRNKQLKIAAETSYIYAPLAHRLGLYNLRSEFTDICLKIAEPDLYFEVENKLKETQKERNKFINDFIRPLKVELEKIAIPYRIFGRSKSISSIANKIKSKKVRFEEIYDLFAIRIVFDTPKEKEKATCWQIYSIVTDVHKPIPDRIRDWITTPRSNGYESLHTTVISPNGKYVEVQIRSERMDDIAEKGYASHWKYKGIANIHGIYDHWFDSIRDILETPHNDAIEFLNDFKSNLYGEEIYVYTPKGEMKILPKGATALDFAYSIHTDIGYHANAFRVNNKLVPMGYELEIGDQIQVITNKNQRPNESWLKLVTTGKAKSRIRHALKEDQKKTADYGKEILERKLRNAKLDFDENLDVLQKSLKSKSRLDMFYLFATEQVEFSEIIKNFRIDHGRLFELKSEPKEVVKDEEEQKPSKPLPANTRILINGESGDSFQYSLAACCNPVQGDDIFAYVTTASGMRIHRTNCPNAEHLMASYSYRIQKAEWAPASGSNFTARLLILGIDEGVGVIERLSYNISSKLGINIKSFSMEGHEGTFEGKISVIVSNKDQLNDIIKSLSNLPGISSVRRIDGEH
ncbi:MAG: RelA/SpoT family protein [Bacteroidota bacterium]|nr:RelA/SpoT family protein [Bacteroidota bacterium]